MSNKTKNKTSNRRQRTRKLDKKAQTDAAFKENQAKAENTAPTQEGDSQELFTRVEVEAQEEPVQEDTQKVLFEPVEDDSVEVASNPMQAFTQKDEASPVEPSFEEQVDVQSSSAEEAVLKVEKPQKSETVAEEEQQTVIAQVVTPKRFTILAAVLFLPFAFLFGFGFWSLFLSIGVATAVAATYKTALNSKEEDAAQAEFADTWNKRIAVLKSKAGVLGMFVIGILSVLAEAILFTFSVLGGSAETAFRFVAAALIAVGAYFVCILCATYLGSSMLALLVLGLYAVVFFHMSRARDKRKEHSIEYFYDEEMRIFFDRMTQFCTASLVGVCKTLLFAGPIGLVAIIANEMENTQLFEYGTENVVVVFGLSYLLVLALWVRKSFAAMVQKQNQCVFFVVAYAFTMFASVACVALVVDSLIFKSEALLPHLGKFFVYGMCAAFGAMMWFPFTSKYVKSDKDKAVTAKGAAARFVASQRQGSTTA